MTRRDLLVGLIAMIAGTLVPVSGRAGDEEPLRIGVAPHTSARFVLELYQPLREHLERELNRPVDVMTAPDFTTFVRRALALDYDIAITTGHQAQVLRVDAGCLPLRTYAAEFRAVVVVPVESPATNAAALANSRVIGLSPTSLVTQWGQHWLTDQGVPNIEIRYVSAADSVAQLVLAGEASAGLFSTANFLSLSPEVRARLRFLARSEPMLGRVYMLNPHQAPQLERIQAALDHFAASPEGKRYFENNSLLGYRPVRPEELTALDRYAREVRDYIATQRAP